MITWINDDFSDQTVHRSGWKDTIAHLKKTVTSNVPIIIDTYLDATFNWRLELFSEQLPFKRAWIGFLHHTLEGMNGAKATIETSQFQESLPFCKGIIVLSNSLKEAIQNLISVPITVLTHPTEFPDTKFTMAKYISTSPTMLHIGNWNRDVFRFLDYNTTIKKVLLKSIRNDYANLDDQYPSVDFLDFLENDVYDNLLSKSIVFIYLNDASAVNTIIECIVRDCPIVVNRLPATIEALGDDYPLYYGTSLTLNNVSKAYIYLKNLDKTKFLFSTFSEGVQKIIQPFLLSPDDICCICLDELSTHEGGLQKLDCNHMFGKKCILQWEGPCPLCQKKRIVPVTTNRPSTSDRTYQGHSIHRGSRSMSNSGNRYRHNFSSSIGLQTSMATAMALSSMF